jgi:hypothetical protein
MLKTIIGSIVQSSPVNNPLQDSPIPQKSGLRPTSQTKKISTNKKIKLFIRVGALFLIPVVGAIAGLSLVSINQDLRQQAAEDLYTGSPSTAQQTGSGLCATLTCPAGQTKQPIAGDEEICQCMGGTETASPEIAVGKLPNGGRCSENSDCSSNNCQAAPGGKYCLPAEQNITSIAFEGETCGTTAFRQCGPGLICRSGVCQNPVEVPLVADGQCLGAGETCSSGRGYSDPLCGGRNIRCGRLARTIGGTSADCQNFENQKTCDSTDQCRWYECSDSCFPARTSLVDAGCAPANPTPTITSADCQNFENQRTCDSTNQCAWYECSDSCFPARTSLVGAGCAPACPTVLIESQACSFNGQVCEKQAFYPRGALYTCEENRWQRHGEQRIAFADDCSEEERNSYLENIANLPLELHTDETINISCPDLGLRVADLGKEGEYAENTACGTITYGVVQLGIQQPNNIALSCFDPTCYDARSGYDCAFIVNHEFAHNYAEEIGGSAEIDSFNKAIGCRSNGKGEFTFDESPVSSYGESSCGEAFADLIALYSRGPCSIARNPKYANQHDWLVNNEDSPFFGKDLCQ